MSSILSLPLKGTLSLVRDKLTIPLNNSLFEISTSSFITMEDLLSHLSSKGITNIEFLSTEGTSISPTTHIQTIKHLPLYMKIDESLYKIIPTGTVCHYSTLDLYDSLNMSPKDRKIVQAYVRHFNKLFTHADLITKDELINTIHSLVTQGNSEYMNNKKRMVNLECERAQMLEEFKNIQKSAEKYARRILWVGFGVSALQCAYIGVGTYLIYSWDFMEPQAYAINLGNFILAFAGYAVRRQEVSRDRAFEFLTKKRMEQKSKIQGFDLERFNEITEELKVLKSKY